MFLHFIRTYCYALNLVAPIRCPTQAATETDNHFSIIESEKRMTLSCRGFVIDDIRAISDMISPSELTVTTLEQETKKKIPFLIDHFWEQLVVKPRIPLNSTKGFFAALGLVLTGGYLTDADSTSGEKQEQQQADLAALIMEYERIRPLGHSDGFLASLTPEDKKLVHSMAARGSEHQFVQDMTWTSMCRKVFRTSEGHIGLGPRIMRQGDICVVLLGAVYPMVLRASGEFFELIGPALVYGFMNGQAESLCRDGALLERDFRII